MVSVSSAMDDDLRGSSRPNDGHPPRQGWSEAEGENLMWRNGPGESDESWIEKKMGKDGLNLNEKKW